MMKRLLTFAAAVGAALGLAACGGASSAPAAPTSPGQASVAAIVVTGLSAASANFQLTASARLADGTMQDVTKSARWESLNPGVATVDTLGFLTIVASGVVEVRATYQNVSGSFTSTVSQPKYRLTGVVRESIPNSQPVAGARVAITAGPNAGMSALSDSGGAFVFASLSAGIVSMEATKDGYLTAVPESFMLSADRDVDVFIVEVPPTDASGATATARCYDGTWSWAQTRGDACAANGGIAYPVCPGPLCPQGVHNAARR